MSRKKLTVKIEPGQACIVMEHAHLQYIIDSLKIESAHAKYPDQKQICLELIDIIRRQIDETYYPFEDENE